MPSFSRLANIAYRCGLSARDMTPTSSRDSFLDIAKGMAIILVIIGHFAQSATPQYDDSLLFRVIYSFHMPLFVFLSGAVASLYFQPADVSLGAVVGIRNLWKRMSKGFLRLVLPFIAWALIGQAIHGYHDNLLQAVVMAFRRPDGALWFLLCIFYCIVLLSLFQLLFALFFQGFHRITKFQGTIDFFLDGRVQIILILGLWVFVRPRIPFGAGLGLLKPYFFYFVLGIGFYKYVRPYFYGYRQCIPFAIFVLLIPFWHRTMPNQVQPELFIYFNSTTLVYCFSMVVAIAGICVALNLAQCASKANLPYLNPFLIYCGKLSLGIYALHYYFLSLKPPVLAPLLLSLLISMLIMQIPGVRTVLLGEK